ncbi:putative transcription factor B3-Domain family [Helianthus anomalus]
MFQKVKENTKSYEKALKLVDVQRKGVARINEAYNSVVHEFKKIGDKRLRMPADIVRIGGFKNKVHQLKVMNMKGKTIDMNLKRQKNGDAVRYAIEGWPTFMKDNGLHSG